MWIMKFVIHLRWSKPKNECKYLIENVISIYSFTTGKHHIPHKFLSGDLVSLLFDRRYYEPESDSVEIVNQCDVCLWFYHTFGYEVWYPLSSSWFQNKCSYHVEGNFRSLQGSIWRLFILVLICGWSHAWSFSFYIFLHMVYTVLNTTVPFQL